MEEAQEAGKIRSIGVSNMTPKLWKKFVPDFDVMPAVNQVEFNPTSNKKNCVKSWLKMGLPLKLGHRLVKVTLSSFTNQSLPKWQKSMVRMLGKLSSALNTKKG